MARFGMVIDTRKCVGCMDCVVACKTENGVPDGYTRDWIVSELRGEFPHIGLEIRSERCNHCDNPPCVACCPTGASHVEPLGRTVQVTANRCIGCKACVAACPYGARYVHPDGYVDKCTFCAHRTKEGKRPGMRLGVPGARDDVRRPRRSDERDRDAAALAPLAHAAARSGHEAACLLPDMTPCSKRSRPDTIR